MPRTSDLICDHIAATIAALEVPQALKDETEWEAVAFMAPDGQGGANLQYLIGIGLPDHGTGDYQMPFQLITDPHDLMEIARVARSLFSQVNAQLSVSQMDRYEQADRHREQVSPGGLIVPGS